jgi:tetratricopeptide (TPR) repeat protein
MRKALGLILAVIFLSSIALTQENQQVMQRQQRGQRGDAARPDAKKISPEQQERAMQLLDGAAAGAAGLDSGSRAYSLIQVARVYQSTDKKKAVELLEQAMTAASEVGRENDRLKEVGSQLQQEVLKAMVPLAPEKVDDLLTQLDAHGREQVLQALLNYYEREKKMDRALEVVYRMGAEGEIPYGAATKIMEKMKPEQAAEKQQLFTASLASYRDHLDQQNANFGRGDFGDMITRFAKDLPSGLVHQAIDVVLDGARKESEKQAKASGGTTFSIASAQGAVQMSSVYQYRLFQLLPVLRSIDPDEADRLLKEQNEVQTLLAKYPQGMNSVAPNSGNDPGQPGGASFMISGGGPGGGPGGGGGGPRRGPGGPGEFNPLEMQKAAKIAEDAEKHPQDAMANAASLQDQRTRANAYLSIAQATWKKQPGIAKQALDKAADTIDKVDGEQQVMLYREVVQFYVRMGETDEAKKYIEKGMGAAAKVYKDDTNPDDPNQAPKAFWPSVAGWRAMLSMASDISPLWASTLLKEIPDEEARTLGQLGIATALLQAEAPRTEIMTFTKEGARMMITASGRDSDQ